MDNKYLDDNGNIPVWGKMSMSGKPYYTFTGVDGTKYIMFPQVSGNPKAPKFIIKKTDKEKYNSKEE